MLQIRTQYKTISTKVSHPRGETDGKVFKKSRQIASNVHILYVRIGWFFKGDMSPWVLSSIHFQRTRALNWQNTSGPKYYDGISLLISQYLISDLHYVKPLWNIPRPNNFHFENPESREYELMTEAHAKLSVVRNCSRSSLHVCLGEGEQLAGGGRSAVAGGGRRQTVHRERERQKVERGLLLLIPILCLRGYIREQECKIEANANLYLIRKQRWARATFFESAIAIPQLEGSTYEIAIPQLLKKCYSATATPQFRNHNLFWSPQLESLTSTIFGAFLAMKSGRFMKKNQVKNLLLLSL